MADKLNCTLVRKVIIARIGDDVDKLPEPALLGHSRLPWTAISNGPENTPPAHYTEN